MREDNRQQDWFDWTLALIHRGVILVMALGSATLVTFHIWELLRPVRQAIWRSVSGAP